MHGFLEEMKQKEQDENRNFFKDEKVKQLAISAGNYEVRKLKMARKEVCLILEKVKSFSQNLLNE